LAAERSGSRLKNRKCCVPLVEMKQLVLSAVKFILGDEYPRFRARIVSTGEIWDNRLKNARYRMSDATRFDLDRQRLDAIKQVNRRTCNSISGWWDRELFARSVCNYGISAGKTNLLDAKIGPETTLSDVVAYHCNEMPTPARYLEIGVSVGKNFMQVLGAKAEGSFSGFDIEDINPVIAHSLRHISREEWPARDSGDAKRASGTVFARQSPSTLDIYEDRSGKKKIRYIAGDVFDERCWQVLARDKYDLIFSDALHTGAAIKHEYAMMKKYALFDRDRLTIIWDDLHFPGMREAFLEITDDLRSIFGESRSTRSLHLVYGWAGRHEGYRHLVGVFHAGPK
jgi:hypothetical protein